ncbi:ATP-binding protein [Sphaerisporangium sp. NPDC049003]|uniref:ATP-binding protein n=1 Tax=Sphaerisporangium sp. NPDC049003 TaxID=3364517 RepID=UPI0037107C40
MDATTMEERSAPEQRFSIAQQFNAQALEPIRRLMEIHLALWKMQQVSDRCLLVLTELCSNVRHTDSEQFVLTVRGLDFGVQLGVRDYSTVVPSVPQEMPDLDAPSGRGLYLVAQYADAFGVQRLTDGKVMWARVGADVYSSVA